MEEESRSQEAASGHVVVVDVDQLRAAGDDAHHRCAACSGLSPWVVVGRCGHRAVCPKCMVRNRFFHRYKRCRVCQAPCPKVLVTRASGGATILPASLPFPLPFRDGKAGKYWYHSHTAAYFEDEQEYRTAREACRGIVGAFYEPLILLLSFGCIFVGMGIGLGAIVMWEIKQNFSSWAMKMNQKSLQITVFALAISFSLSMCAFFWYLIKRSIDPLEVEAFLKDTPYPETMI